MIIIDANNITLNIATERHVDARQDRASKASGAKENGRNRSPNQLYDY